MGAAYFVCGLLATMGITAWLVRKYGDPKISYGVLMIVYFTWMLSFSVVFVLPMDVSATFYMNCIKIWYCGQSGNEDTDGCGSKEDLLLPNMSAMCQDAVDCTCAKPASFVNDTLLTNFWNVIYWSSQALTWLILPITESYMSAGDFSFGQRLKSSLKENAIVYGSLGIIFIGVFAYVAVKDHLDQDGLKRVLIITSNTWGLLALVLLLGYGIVDVPRNLWTSSDIKRKQRHLQFKAAKLSTEIAEAESTEETINTDVRTMAGRVKQGDPLRKYVNIVLLKANLDDGEGGFEDYRPSGDAVDEPVTRSKLASLHKRVIKSKRVLNRCRCQWNDLMAQAIHVQDILSNRDSTDHHFSSNIGVPVRHAEAYWWWEVRIRPILWYILSGICTIMSIILLWSEISFSKTDPTLSIYALMVIHAGNAEHYINLEFLVFVTLLFMCVCTYTVIFKIRVFDFYYLVPGRQTDSSSMLFAAMILSRLTPALCLNFIALAHLDNHINKITLHQDLYFTQIQGHMDLFTAINMYYPIIMVVIAVFAFFSLGNRVLLLCGVQRYLEDDPETDELCAEGKILISRDRRRRERLGNAKTNMMSAKERIMDDSRAAAAAKRNRNGDEDDDGGSRGGWDDSAGSSDRDRERRVQRIDDAADDDADLDYEDYVPAAASSSGALGSKKSRTSRAKRDKSASASFGSKYVRGVCISFETSVSFILFRL
eukprot:m.1130343 g.1130343  ORF g.1130343 m.1130343 type:complete len:710 (-) comp24422_c0_seq2:993-3122(-)